MKAYIIRGTTLNGVAVNEGQVIDLDDTSFKTFAAYQQAREATQDEVDADLQARAKAAAEAKAKADAEAKKGK